MKEDKDIDKVEDDDNIENKPKEEVKKPQMPLSERIDDVIDEVVGNTQDFFYGERKDYTHDIPATMPDPDNEIRHINKVQTRRNFNKRVFGKKGLKIFLIILAVGLAISGVYVLIEKLLLA